MHYSDAIMGEMSSQITSLTIVYSNVYSGVDQSKHQSSASLAFVWGIHRGPVNSPHKWSVTRKMFPFDDVIMGMTKAADLVFNHGCTGDHFIQRNPCIQPLPNKKYEILPDTTASDPFKMRNMDSQPTITIWTVFGW